MDWRSGPFRPAKAQYALEEACLGFCGDLLDGGKKNEGSFWWEILLNQEHAGRGALQPDATKRLIARFLIRKGLWK